VNRLLPAVLISAAVHGLVLSTWPDARVELGEVSAPVLHARLMSRAGTAQPDPQPQPTTAQVARPPAAAASRPDQHKPAPTAVAHKAPAPTPAPRPAPATSVESASTEIAPEATPPQRVVRPTRSSATQSREQILATVHGQLANRFFYPQLARRKGWQGRVDLGFRVEADGRIERIRVVRSSGHGILDRSAIQALREVGRVSVAGPKLGSPGWDLDLPVIYRLREG